MTERLYWLLHPLPKIHSLPRKSVGFGRIIEDYPTLPLQARMRSRMVFEFKKNTPFEQRAAEAARVRERHASRVPVIVEKAPNSDVPSVDKCAQLAQTPAPTLTTSFAALAHTVLTAAPPRARSKYLIPMDMTVGQLVYVLRKRIELPSDKAVFIFINNTLPPSSALVSNVYLKHRDEDGFLYICYSGENAFGSSN